MNVPPSSGWNLARLDVHPRIIAVAGRDRGDGPEVAALEFASGLRLPRPFGLAPVSLTNEGGNMAVMRVAQVSRPKGPFEIVERPIPEPGAGTVRIKVQACGICHSDSLTKEGAFPGIQYPRVPGHEVAGVIDAVGPGVAGWEPGQRVGVGWNGGYCGYCDHCRRGEFFACVRGQITGITLRRRLRGVPGRPRQRGRAHAGRSSARRGGPADVRRASPRSTRCGTAAHGRATSSPCSGWAGSATSASSTPRRWAFTRSASRAGRTRSRSPASSARRSTSTARRRTRRRSSSSWAARRSSWRRRPAARR